MAKLAGLYALLFLAVGIAALTSSQSWSSVSLLLVLVAGFGITISLLSDLKQLSR